MDRSVVPTNEDPQFTRLYPPRNVRGSRERWVGFIKGVHDWCGGPPHRGRGRGASPRRPRHLFELRPDTLDAASTTIITGPSKTADIEGLLVMGLLVMGVLVMGVHGPTEVEIVLVG